MKINYLAICMMLLFMITSCSRTDNDQSEEGNFAELYGGNPYKGTVIGTRSEGGNQTHRWEGDGRIVFIESTTDSISLVVMADFENVGEVNLKLRGAYNQNSFFVENDNIKFNISNQKITGNTENAVQKMAFDGTLTNNRSALVIAVEFIEGQEGFPPGSILEMIFDTSREVNNNNEGGCNMRMVPIWGPSGMTMGMVPDC